jgi:hypothetical protein
MVYFRQSPRKSGTLINFLKGKWLFNYQYVDLTGNPLLYILYTVEIVAI